MIQALLQPNKTLEQRMVEILDRTPDKVDFNGYEITKVISQFKLKSFLKLIRRQIKQIQLNLINKF